MSPPPMFPPRAARVLVLSLALATPSWAGGQSAPAPNPTYQAVVEGMTCRQNQNGRLDCVYEVARSLRFVIAGVGQDEAVISFSKVDSTGGFVAGFSPFHGCVVVKPAGAGDSSTALAFVSPRDGRVYRVWQHCRQPPRR